MAEGETEERRTTIDWPAAVAGAGAAVTVAVLLSTLGAAGTLIGAALGSVIATVSSALYKQGIESSRRRVVDLQDAVLQRVNLAEQSLHRAAERSDGEATDRELARAQRHLEAVSEDLADAATVDDDEEPAAGDLDVPPDRSDPPGGADGSGRWASLPWKRIAVLTAAVFLLALLVIGAFELIAGRSVSTITGGTDGDDRTSFGGVFDDGSTDRDERQQKDPAQDATTDAPTPTPTESPSSQAPVQSETPSPSETPTPSATVTVTETATPTPVPTPTPTAPATPAP